MTFRRTTDRELIRALITHPKVWRWSSEDGMEAAEYEPAVDNPAVWYVAAVEGRTLLGIFVFEPRTSVKYAVHLAIAPSQWARGVESFKGVIHWAWENIGMQRITGEIPMDAKHADRLARKAGFECVGIEKGAFMRGGVLQDVRIVGLSREAS